MSLDPRVPPEIRRAAEERATARAARDWATADRLRAEIEGAGWRIVDTGTSFRLEPAHAPDVVEGEVVLFGSSASVPSRLDEPDAGDATVIVIGHEHPEDVARAVGAVVRYSPAATVVVVADGEAAGADASLGALGERVEVVRTSAPLGHGAALQIGLRRAAGRVVVVVDPSVEATGDIVRPLVAALDDPTVGVVGAFGLVSEDLRRYEEVAAGEAAAIEGYVLAFRRADGAARGPVDEHFRFYRNLDIWWSLVLRDEGEDARPRRALVVGGLPLVRHEHRGWTALPPAERERLSKRNFYRIIDRFGARRDLAVAAGQGSAG